MRNLSVLFSLVLLLVLGGCYGSGDTKDDGSYSDDTPRRSSGRY